MEALEKAIAAAGGVGLLAGKINVSPSAPSMWKARKRVPAEYCPAIERETGVRCEELRPDVAWDVLRMQSSAAESELIGADGAPSVPASEAKAEA